jgi:hypothetical protein
MFILIIAIAGTFMLSSADSVQAASDENKLSVMIVAPSEINDYPNREETITVRIKNNTNLEYKNMFIYTNALDISEVQITPPAEGYDMPKVIESLPPGQSRDINIKTKFTVPHNYYLYACVISKDFNETYTSNKINVNISSSTRIVKSMVNTVALLEPLILLMITLFWVLYKKCKFKIN